MDIKNINTPSSKNLQLVATFAEKDQRAYKDLLEFQYLVNGEKMTVRQILEEIFLLREREAALKTKITDIFQKQQKTQELLTKSIDLLDTKILQLTQRVSELEIQVKKNI